MIKEFTIHKKFEIHAWLIQPDATSCGYYLIHNAHPYLKVPHYEGSPNSVFEKVNELRMQNGDAPLPRDRNLLSDDLRRYFVSKGFGVSQLSNPHFDVRTIDNVLGEGNFRLIYLSSNAHYTGIVKDQRRLLYLDSLTDGPSVLSDNEARDKIITSLGQDRSGRYDIVGIVK